MSFTEQQVYEALGLGEKVQEPAKPAEQGMEQPAEKPAEAEQVTEVPTEPEAQAGGEQKPAEKQEEGAQQQVMPPEKRRENAARRRQEEQRIAIRIAIDRAVQEAIQQEREKTSAEMQEFFSKAGLKNTVTGQPITNMEEFRAWNEQFSRAKLERELKEGKLTPEGLETAIGSHPAIKQAQQLAADRKAQEQAQKADEIKARIDAEVAEIHKLDASINSLEDLLRAPYGQELYAMTQRGYSIKDAHFLLNHERLEQAKLEAARQQAMAGVRNKDHLTGTGTPRGGGAISVPSSDLAMFRQFNPGASDAQIQDYYNKYMKAKGGV